MSVAGRALAAAFALALAGCDRGRSACEVAVQAALEQPATYRRISVVEEPGETPAMTYYVVDYLVTGLGGRRLREQVHCAYMPDTGEAVPQRVSSVPAPE